MKTLALLLASSFALAQAPTLQNIPPPRSKQGHEKAVANDAPQKKKMDQISGQCVVLPGGGNLIASPCPEVILNLEGKGEPLHARTDRNGIFEFATEQGAEYKVSSGSRFYDVVEPKRPVHSGQQIEIHLKQKN